MIRNICSRVFGSSVRPIRSLSVFRAVSSLFWFCGRTSTGACYNHRCGDHHCKSVEIGTKVIRIIVSVAPEPVDDLQAAVGPPKEPVSELFYTDEFLFNGGLQSLLAL